jgi:hypothetical protein
MEGIGVMALEKEMRERLAKAFKVPEDLIFIKIKAVGAPLLPL